ncbi:MAG: DUF2510 domain-containing protein [Actinomycetaceae bacterium]
MSTVEAGWYSDPWEDGKIRFWDGVTWTDEQYDAEDSEYDVHGSEDPAPPVDHTVAPSSVLQSGQAHAAETVAPAQDPVPGLETQVPPSAPSAPGYGQGHGQVPGQMPPSAPSAPGYGPGYGQVPPSAPSAPGYGPGFGQVPPSAPSAPGYGPGGPTGAPSQHAGQYGGSGHTAASGWSAGSSAEPGWAAQTGPGFYSLPGAGSPGSTGPVAGSGQTAPFATGTYGDYPAAGAGGYASGGTAAYVQGPGQAWAGSPDGAGGFGGPGGPGVPAYQGSGYGGPQKRSAMSPAVLALIGVVVVAILGVGSYFLFFSGDDTAEPTGPGGGSSQGGEPAPAPAGAAGLTDATGAEVPADGTVDIPAGGSWTATLTVNERTGFLALAARSGADPVMSISGNGIDVEVDDIGQGANDLSAIGGDSGLDAAVGLVLEPGTYTLTVTDWAGSGGQVPFAYRTGLTGTAADGTPMPVSVPPNDLVMVEVPGSGALRTETTDGTDPQLVVFPSDGSDAEYNDDGSSSAPPELAANMEWLDSFVDVYFEGPSLAVVSTFMDRGGSTSLIYQAG